jgi:bifunctional DNA-binding transcriptional regulator/antitoxin component of YhaV-PrlF toxin-antitoxin module
MLAKMTSKNQITIPKKIIEQLPDVEYFEVELKDGVVMLKPLRIYDTSLNKIRTKIKKLGLQENTVKEAIEWARSKS